MKKKIAQLLGLVSALGLMMIFIAYPAISMALSAFRQRPNLSTGFMLGAFIILALIITYYGYRLLSSVLRGWRQPKKCDNPADCFPY